MLSQAELSREWDCTRSYVSQVVKRGCPLDSIEAANRWRDENCGKKPPCAPKPEGFEGPGKGVNVKKLGSAVSATTKSRKSAQQGDDRTRVPERPRRRPVPHRPISADPMENALNKALDAFDEVNALLCEAMEEGNVARTSALLSIHNKALQAMFDAQERYREEQERRKVLVNIVDAKAFARRGYDVMLQRLKAMPQKMSGQVNRQEPLLAYKLLAKEVDEIVEEASRVYAPSVGE